MQSATQMAGPWVNITVLYPGVTLNKNDLRLIFRCLRFARSPNRDRCELRSAVISSQVGAVKFVRISAVGVLQSNEFYA